MNDNLAQRLFFGLLLVGVTVAFIWLIRGFVQPIFWAVALGIVFFPLHKKFVALLRGRASAAAALTVIVIVLSVVVPLAAIGTAMAAEAAAFVDRLQSAQQDGAAGDGNDISAAIDWVTDKLPVAQNALESINIDIEALKEQLSGQLSSSAIVVGQFIGSQAVAIGQNTIRLAIYFFLMLYLLYFFMRDGTRILDGLVRALPFGDERERHLIERFAQVSRATIKGTLVVGIVQGTIGGILFALLGIGGPVLWGVVMALLSLIPAVGPAVVWIPAAIILIANGQIWQGIVVIVVGTVVIGLADNFLRPLLVGRDTKMPDYLILLATLGGLTAFGIAGVVIGPIIAAFFLSVWEMAVEEYGDGALEQDRTHLS